MLFVCHSSITAQETAEVKIDTITEKWVSTVGGEAVYSGYRMFDAVNAACNELGAGKEGANNIINIRNSGRSGQYFFTSRCKSICEQDSMGDWDVIPEEYCGNYLGITEGNRTAYSESYSINPLSHQTLDFHGNTVLCENVGYIFNAYVNAIHAEYKDGIVIKDLRVTGNPDDGILLRHCNDVTITNIEMDLNSVESEVFTTYLWDDDEMDCEILKTRGNGILVDSPNKSKEFYDKNDNYPSNNLIINGNISISGAYSYGIKTYSINGVSIGDITVTNTGACGVLLNNSINCEIGVVTGYRNGMSSSPGCATFRVANKNHKTHCKGVYSRNSGRGFFSVSGSSDCTVDYVDIRNITGTNSQCILIDSSVNTHVLSGVATNCTGEHAIANRGVGYHNSIFLDESYSSINIQEKDAGFIKVDGEIESDLTAGYTEYGYANTDNSTRKSIEWEVDGGAGDYTFRWRFANGSSVNRFAKLFIDDVYKGTISFSNSNSWSDWRVTAAKKVSGVNSGTKRIRLEAIQNEGLANIDNLNVIRPNTSISSTDIQTIVIQELETGFYDIDDYAEGKEGEITSDATPGYTGYGYANTYNALGQGIDWNIDGREGTYTFRWRFANGSSLNRKAILSINGKDVSTRDFIDTKGWSKWATTSVKVYNVEGGIKSIRLRAIQNEGLANIDYLEVTGPGVTRSFKEVSSLYRDYDNVSSSKTLEDNCCGGDMAEVPDLLTVTSFSPEEVFVYDLTGKLISAQVLNTTEEQINTEGLSQGIYIIKSVISGQESTVKKYIKN